jgi:hypothetical protein
MRTLEKYEMQDVPIGEWCKEKWSAALVILDRACLLHDSERVEGQRSNEIDICQSFTGLCKSSNPDIATTGCRVSVDGTVREVEREAIETRILVFLGLILFHTTARETQYSLEIFQILDSQAAKTASSTNRIVTLDYRHLH